MRPLIHRSGVGKDTSKAFIWTGWLRSKDFRGSSSSSISLHDFIQSEQEASGLVTVELGKPESEVWESVTSRLYKPAMSTRTSIVINGVQTLQRASRMKTDRAHRHEKHKWEKQWNTIHWHREGKWHGTENERQCVFSATEKERKTQHFK